MKKIMIVDDSGFSRNIMKQMVESGGYQAIEAASGAEALKLFETEKPDAITMDLLMPDMDGMDVVRKIMEMDADAKIIICSTDKQKYRQDEAKETRVQEFIPKPVDSEKLLNTLKNIL